MPLDPATKTTQSLPPFGISFGTSLTENALITVINKEIKIILAACMFKLTDFVLYGPLLVTMTKGRLVFIYSESAKGKHCFGTIFVIQK